MRVIAQDAPYTLIEDKEGFGITEVTANGCRWRVEPSAPYFAEEVAAIYRQLTETGQK